MSDLIEIEDPSAAITVAEPIVIGEAMLSKEEARQIVTNINRRMEQSRRDLLELYDRGGWHALGYSSWGSCVKAEFEGSSTALYRQLAAAKIEREVFGDSRIGNPVPASQLEVVKDLPTEQKRAAFQRADELAGDQPRTARHITQAAAEIAQPDLPIDYTIIMNRLAMHGIKLRHKDGDYILLDRAGAESRTREWDRVLDRLSLLEDGMENDPIEQPKMPEVPPEMDSSLPNDLHRAGYYWHSATPPTIALNGSDRRWDAPTVEGAIAGARTHFDAKGEPIAIFPALTPLECKALIREAKLFIESGADRKLPTIGRILRIAARMALEATE